MLHGFCLSCNANSFPLFGPRFARGKTSSRGSCLFRTPPDLQTGGTGAGKQKTWDERPKETINTFGREAFREPENTETFFCAVRRVISAKSITSPLHFACHGSSGAASGEAIKVSTASCLLRQAKLAPSGGLVVRSCVAAAGHSLQGGCRL